MSRARLVLVAVLALLVAQPAAADFNVSGTFLYRDRDFGVGGFTGNDTNKPIRRAKVQVIDASSSAVLATGLTTDTGAFAINVVDSQTRDLYIRVLTDSTRNQRARVLRTNDRAIFALATAVYSSHAPTTNIDFVNTPVVAQQLSSSATIGEAFNIFDQALDAFDFVEDVHGSRPTRLMTLLWARGSNDGTYYSHGDASIHLYGIFDPPGAADSDGYDDTVILHEIGHYIEYNLADSDNPGGPHSLNGYYALTLTWSEGQSTFFSNMVRNFRGLPRPDLYVDTRGLPGPGQAFISYDLENPVFGLPGANNEVTVNALLWDIVDTPSTADGAPGSDDDFMNLTDGANRCWDVMVNYIRLASSISLEDFWDGWFVRNHNHEATMRTLFASRGVEYFPDEFEPDGSVGLAKTVVAGSPPQHHTTYPAGDQDWFVIGVVGGSQYVFETENLLSGANTQLELYAADGTTLLAQNNDRVIGDPSSRIAYTPPNSGLVYLKCIRATDPHTYGSWDLRVTGVPVAVEITEVHVEGGPTGVQIRWRARIDGSFERFEVERGPEREGPWTVLGTVLPKALDGNSRVYEYLDPDLATGLESHYRIVGIESNGERQAIGPFAPTAPPPVRLALQTPRPNPFNPSAIVTFDLPREMPVWMRIYAADGRLVRTLVAGATVAAGRREARWDGRDDSGRFASSGVYWFRLEAGGEHRTTRGILLR